LFFAPLFCSLAPTAGRIVVLIGLFFNCHALDVGVCPFVELMTVEGNALFSNGEFADVGADGFVENCPTHAEVSRCVFRPDEAGRGL